MLSIINRRLVSSTRSAVVMLPSTPQRQEPSIENNGVKPNADFNAVHALYNNENQSLHESHLNSTPPGQTYRSLSEDDNHSAFSPTFNSVFDE
ncbi:unnamed protein product [Mucor hiemalis]